MKTYNNIEERFFITDTRGKYDLAGNQMSLLKKLKKIIKNKNLKLELEEIKKIIRKNQPNYSDSDILELANEISHSGCAYVAAASSIFEQLNYDEQKFYELFGFSMKNKKGILNHDMLIAELYSFMKDRVKLEIKGKTEIFTFDSVIEAAKKLIGINCKTVEEAFIAVVNAGYHIDESYTKFVPNPQKYIGHYKDIGKQILGNDASFQNIEELKNALSNNHIHFSITDLFNPTKLSGLSEKNFDNWLNYYFKEKNIDLEFTSTALKITNYDALIDEIKNRMNSGEVITVGVGHYSDEVFMTDGSRYGWTKFSLSEKHGHMMPLIGISDKGDFIVSSWGEKYKIPKEYYKFIDFRSRKMKFKKNIKINEENSNNHDSNNQNTETELQQDSIYKFINEKIAYMNSRLNNAESSTYDSMLYMLYNQLFSPEEKSLITYAKPIITDENGNTMITNVIIIQKGEENIYKIFIPGNGFIEVSKEYFENLIMNNQILDDGSIIGLKQSKR